jgi:integrase
MRHRDTRASAWRGDRRKALTRPGLLLNKGLRLEIVSKLLGHANTTITERAYAQLLDETTRRELLQALNQAA